MTTEEWSLEETGNAELFDVYHELGGDSNVNEIVVTEDGEPVMRLTWARGARDGNL